MSMQVVNEEDVPLQLFEICLHREEFFPGEVITGKLLIVTSKQLKTEGIFIKFEGGLHEAEFVHDRRKYFSNVFRYDFDALPVGSSVLTFEFELPTGIPQSIEAGVIMKQLKILYLLEALIRTPKEDYRQQKCLVVNGILNLNVCPELSLPVCKTIREAVFESCWSSFGRVIVMSFSIKKQGFVAGEQLKAELIIKDSCHNSDFFGGVEVQLIQEIDLQISTASRVKRRIVTKSDMVHVTSSTVSNKQTKCPSNKNKMSKDSARKFDFFLTIPDDILISYGNTNTQVHDFISIHYFIRMSMEQISFPYKPLQINLPIKIGTVFIKEQKAAVPILLVAPVPLALPRPKLPLENGCRRSSNNNVDKHLEKPAGSVNCVDTVAADSLASVNLMPQNHLNSKNSLTLFEQQAPSSSSVNVSPRTPKRKLGNVKNIVGDSSGSLRKAIEAFGGDSDTESFR